MKKRCGLSKVDVCVNLSKPAERPAVFLRRIFSQTNIHNVNVFSMLLTHVLCLTFATCAWQACAKGDNPESDTWHVSCAQELQVPKVALLFLAYHRIHHFALWKTWLEQVVGVVRFHGLKFVPNCCTIDLSSGAHRVAPATSIQYHAFVTADGVLQGHATQSPTPPPPAALFDIPTQRT